MAEFPFVYLNHGPLLLESIGKCDGAYVGFVDDVPEALQRALVEQCPEPIRGFASFVGNLLAIESPGDVYDWTMVELYGTAEEKAEAQKKGWAEIGRETADRFGAAVEAWAQAMHAMHPIAFFMGPGSTEGSDWDAWSRERFAQTVVPFLEALVAEHPELKEPESFEDEDYDSGEYDDDLDEEEVADTLIDQEISLVTIQPLRHGHIACLLQDFEPEHDVPVADALRGRVDALLQTFEL